MSLIQRIRNWFTGDDPDEEWTTTTGSLVRCWSEERGWFQRHWYAGGPSCIRCGEPNPKPEPAVNPTEGA